MTLSLMEQRYARVVAKRFVAGESVADLAAIYDFPAARILAMLDSIIPPAPPPPPPVFIPHEELIQRLGPKCWTGEKACL